jgi:formamidopyrimidine-DNA glycosylase
VFVGTSDGGVFASTIGGSTWTATSTGLTDTNILDIEIDQAQATQGSYTDIYVATPSGLFISTTTGSRWQLDNTGLAGQSTRVVSGFGSQKVYGLSNNNRLGLNQKLKNKTIIDVWSSYKSPSHTGKSNIKDPEYFKKFRDMICGAHFLKAERRGKNILIHLSNDHTILIHMKMTGHLLYGQYDFDPKTNTWRADEDGPLQDPFNQHIRLVFSVANATSNIKSENENTNREKNKSRQSETCQLAFSDLRKFAKVFVFPTKELATLPDLVHIGPEPLEKNFTYDEFKTRLQRWPNRPIKQILMDQTAVAGIGNIYSDEMLWAAGIHPLSHIPAIPEKLLQLLFKEMKLVLDRGIYFGGDSESDFWKHSR